jgi:DNA-binding transcriptional ArsR family regulator
MKIEDRLVEDAHALLHPTRYKMVELLSQRSMHIRELSEALEKEDRIVFYHLSILEEHGFVKGDFQVHKNQNIKEITRKHYGMTEKGRFSYNLIILDKERIEDNEKDAFRPREFKKKMVREYHATEKVDRMLLELKNSL